MVENRFYFANLPFDEKILPLRGATGSHYGKFKHRHLLNLWVYAFLVFQIYKKNKN